MVDIDILNDIAVKAGQKILEIYENDIENWDISVKKDNSPLTVADKVSNDFICQELKDNYPELPIISEENKEIDYQKRKKFDFWWCVDPLDGTKEFIKRNGEFTVNIAFMKKDKPLSGVVYAPFLNILYFAKYGEGAFKRDLNKGETARINVVKKRENENIKIVASRSHLNEQTKEIINKFDNNELLSMGSSLKFMLIAEGKAHLYPRIAPTMEWDVAAAHAIVNEAGGVIIDLETKQNMKYNKENMLNNHFIVFGKERFEVL